MLGFIPIFIFLGAAIAVVVLQFVPKGTGIAWLVSIFASISAWIMVLVIKSNLPFSHSTRLFLPLGIERVIPAFQFDIINWPFIFSICGLVIGTLIVSSARIGVDSTSWEWAGILLLGALGISGCLTVNILSGVLILGLFDLVDVAILFTSGESTDFIKDSLKHVTWRLFSLVLFLTASAWQNSQIGTTDDWKSLLPGPGYLILAGCMLRMALLPTIKLTGIPRISTNGLYVTRFIIGFLLSTAIIIQLPTFSGNSLWTNVLLIYLLFIAFIGAFWLIQNKEEEQPIAWQAFAGSLVCAEYIYGFSAAGIFFIITVAVLSQILILSYPVSKFSKGIGIFAIIGFSGLPFTPNNTGLDGFIWNGQIPGFLFLFPAILAFFSSVKNLLNKESLVSSVEERWVGFLAPAGLLFPAITPWIISFIWLQNGLRWNVSIQALIITFAGLGLFLVEKYQFINMDIQKTKIYHAIENARIQLIGFASRSNISFKNFVRQPNLFLTELFEGDGGIIWAIVCMVLVITILQSLGLS